MLLIVLQGLKPVSFRRLYVGAKAPTPEEQIGTTKKRNLKNLSLTKCKATNSQTPATLRNSG
jgi:hypothetical protein